MNFLTQNAHWFLRIALASVFIFHGLLKFLNLEAFAQMLPISYLTVVRSQRLKPVVGCWSCWVDFAMARSRTWLHGSVLHLTYR
ncbi:MAG: hypothetical protein IID60_10185 [Proteobacteria bacterium]|nr:hypothetical protein [Pseudomonadota bacterium]